MLVNDKGLFQVSVEMMNYLRECWANWPHVSEDKGAWMADQVNK